MARRLRITATVRIRRVAINALSDDHYDRLLAFRDRILAQPSIGSPPCPSPQLTSAHSHAGPASVCEMSSTPR
jgi:hypothetical protein